MSESDAMIERGAGCALLSVEEMYRADQAAAKGGTPSLELMETAGASIAGEILARWSARPTVVLCGPGNNGGDGFVIARYLAERGWPVRIALLGSKEKLKGDAAANAERWDGPVEALSPECVADAGLIVDSLFGAGLDRPLEGKVADTVSRVNESAAARVAVDMPSGVHGDSGAELGVAVRADLTITFFRKKPGHLLLPGRRHCGETVVTQIGIPDSVLDAIQPKTFENDPGLWAADLPRPTLEDHKYSRGHAAVAGGETMTGAARLAGRAALRIGAGMVTIVAPERALPIYAAHTAAFLTHAADDAKQFAAFIGGKRVAAILVGPGLGRSNDTRARVSGALGTGKPVVVDADGFSVFEGAPEGLARDGPKVFTPHEGEFARLFDAEGSKLERARAAAAELGGIMLLKGGDTVIAAPDGRAAITANAPPWLATAGAGDVLAGMITGLLAQGMDPFKAALAASWLHGAAAVRFGPALIADDLPDLLPEALRGFYAEG